MQTAVIQSMVTDVSVGGPSTAGLPGGAPPALSRVERCCVIGGSRFREVWWLDGDSG
ncbi:hypothetical protein GCM10027610_080770 [Dactylosporangium cerinum]